MQTHATRNSRKDVNLKVTKALTDEVHFLQKTYRDAPITIVGDLQDTVHSDWRDNIKSGRQENTPK